MSTTRWILCSGLIALAAVHAVPLAVAQTNVDAGKREYEASCMICHGSKGKGDGPYMSYLDKPPSDIATLARRNNGVFPADRVRRIIDGREDLKAHGPREMPIFNVVYRVEAADYWRDRGCYDPETVVRNRIDRLVEYLVQLQEK
jgi:mono/diheme cytochrome c family protein